MYRVDIPAGTLLGFKTAPGADGQELLQDAGDAGADWSALYTQLSIEAALNYLPNQWDRGAEFACLLTLTSRESVVALVCPHEWMGDTRISSTEKAERLRTCLHRDLGVQIAQDKALLLGLGERGFVLAAVDSDDMEIIVPHGVVPRFKFAVVATFKQDRLCKFTTSECQVVVGEKRERIPRKIAQDTRTLGETVTEAIGAVVGDCRTMRKLLDAKG